MNVDELLKIIDGQFINEGQHKKINEFKIDSRNLKKGDVFIALIGPNNDGHNYIQEALNKKVAAVIVCKKVNAKSKIPIILVKDTYETLMKIGAFFRHKYEIPVIGVTGSIGKTTTKELISDILSVKYRVLKNEKNYNNHIGIPLTLTKLNDHYDICVLEMGMNHLGEISRLSKMSKPNVGVITNIGTSHIGNLGSKKNILKAKMEIVDGMNGGLLVVNDMDKMLKHIKYSNILKCCLKEKPFDINVDEKVSFKLKINNVLYNFSYNNSNESLIMNFVLAIHIGLLFDVNIDDITEVISNFKFPKERMEIIELGSTKIINDCYNASLESVVGAINLLKQKTGKKMIILGDILELGKYTIKIHKRIEKELKKLKDIKVLLVGNHTKHIKGYNYQHFQTNQEIINYLNNVNLNDTTVLIKGSRGMHLEEVTKYLLEIL